MARNYEWSHEKTTLLIHYYKSQPCLWDPHDTGYMRRHIKNQSYGEISFETGASIKEVKVKLHGLRSSMLRELHKIERSKLDDGISNNYCPRWKYFNELLFLKDVLQLQPKTSKSNTTINGDIELIDSLFETTEENSQSCNEYDDSLPEQKTTFLEKEIEYPESCNDDAEIFGRAWAAEYRKLTTDQQIYAKKGIDDILYEGRLGKLCEISVGSMTTKNNMPSSTSSYQKISTVYDAVESSDSTRSTESKQFGNQPKRIKIENFEHVDC